ncbi:LysR family transcriptional regulator [Glutamicibacter sp. MNS18]|uniref:LysR family transcriptional regulator n=1 Tax=Glutamicibacter sp. MNS18 TaxID=2989817 RepID=UPI0022354AC9|nr:LysR family transcriptional regulator [Glutamicibacter sp. MNS18]MCW4466560.1 LysR family transcriptional regulator [Glutamicibacter sp. MNS18]
MDTSRTTGIGHWLQISSLALLVGIADHGSLSAGARAVGMAQPNASRALRTLERRLGYQLVTRTRTGSQLTAEGKLTVQWAREVLSSLDTLWTGAQALAGTRDEEFSFATSMTIAEYLAPGWIRQLRQQDPQIRTRMRVMNSEDVIAAVMAREAALGFVETPDIPPGLASRTVRSDQLLLIVPEGHPWAQDREPVSLAELAATALVERETGSGARAFLDKYTGSSRSAPLVEFNSNAAICQAVAAGLGPAVVSRLAIDGAATTHGLIQVPIAGPDLRRELRAIWRPGRPLPAPAARFLAICGTTQS